MKSKKAGLLAALFVICLMAAFTISAAAVSYDTSWAFTTGSDGNTIVNGSWNGVYYSLTKGTATLRLTDGENCYEGGYYANLFVQDGFLGLWSTKVEDVYFNAGPGNMHRHEFSIPKDHDKYYFIYAGDGIYAYYEASGTFSQ